MANGVVFLMTDDWDKSNVAAHGAQHLILPFNLTVKTGCFMMNRCSL
jgi:hypothetical protein